MATREIYVGGPSTANVSRGFFPAAPFNAAGPAFVAGRPAAHQGSGMFILSRVLDFANDKALSSFVSNQVAAADPVVQGDVLGAVLVPRRMLLFGLFTEVEVATGTVGTTTITPTLRGVAGATFGTITGNTVGGAAFRPTGGTAITASAEVGPADLPWYIAAPTVLDLTLTALPAGGLGKLRLRLSLLVMDMLGGQY